MTIGDTQTGMRLNLGSGNVATPGWVCIDRSPNVLLSRSPRIKKLLRRVGLLGESHMTEWDRAIKRADIRDLPYSEGSVDAVYSSHTLEHIYLAEARQVLSEAFRVLKPGGLIRLALPDATQIARRLLDNPDDASAGREFNQALLAHPEAPTSGPRSLIGRAGGHVHRWQPTPALVRAMLDEVGFMGVEEHGYREGDLPDVEIIETRPESFFLEGRKP